MIQHVAREVKASDIPSCLDFYGLLGFAEVEVPPSLAGRAVWVESGGTQVHLLLAGEVAGGGGHIAVVVDDFDDVVAALSAAGHEVDRRREHWGSPRAYVRDPAGHLVELMAFGPGATGNR
ncbi:MAG TPA: VOC family protein [Solirubrobacteraceae bacterium]|nr:VOC family protein [Solirubrobacteraceae bacterium]